MLIEELIDEGTRVHHYSDENFMIRQIETGILYEDAIDVMPCRYTYEETDEPIPEPEPEPEPEEIDPIALRYMRSIPPINPMADINEPTVE